MRKPIEKLARKLVKEPGTATLGELAEKYNESVDPIIDAIDVQKILGPVILDEEPLTYIEVG